MKYSEDDFVIKPVKTNQDDGQNLPIRIPRKYDSTALIASRGSGKSTVIAHLIRTFYAKEYDIIFLCCPTVYSQEVYEEFKKTKNVIMWDSCTPGFLKKIEKVQARKVLKGKKSASDVLIILDDFSIEKQLQQAVSEVVRLRHLKISLIYSAQYYKNINPTCRLNMNQLLIFKSTDLQYKNIALDLPDIDVDDFIALARYATREKGGFLMINKNDIHRPYSIGF